MADRTQLWTDQQSDDEARAYLQARLTLFSKLMFWSLVALLGFIAGMYEAYPDIAPAQSKLTFTGATVGLGIMAVIWRVILVRQKLSITWLYRIDIVYVVTIGSAFGASAVLAPELHPAGYVSLVYAALFVFTRVIIVPSSATRTLIASILAMIPMCSAAIWLAVTTKQELPGPAFVVGAMLLAGVAVLLGTIGSATIYGLRRKVSDMQQLGVYTIEAVLAEGGMGVVLQARHALLRRATAVKVMSPDRFAPEDLDRFEGEVKFMSQLTHPNNVAVYDYGRSAGRVYYAMELLDGMDLGRLVKSYGAQPPGRVAQILAQVCGALQEAHDKGSIHRDIKPGNIILCERGGIADVAKVVDYGLVREITDKIGNSQEVVLGTPDYMAPEAFNSAGVTPARDLYALGCVGYFLLAGKRPFSGNAVEVIVAHATKAPPPLDGDPALVAVVMRLLAKDPAARYASAAELAQALEALPVYKQWTRDDARAWWRDHQAVVAATPSSDQPTVPLTIDLQGRVNNA